jgi:hypothetical protein
MSQLDVKPRPPWSVGAVTPGKAVDSHIAGCCALGPLGERSSCSDGPDAGRQSHDAVMRVLGERAAKSRVVV